LLGVFLFDLGLQILAWIPASLLRTEAFYDLTGSLTFLASATGTLWLGGAAAAPRARAATALLCCWAARLGVHLVRRIARDGRDKRFDRVREKPFAFLLFWLVQGVWVFVTSLPVLLLNTQPSAAALRPTDVAGAPPRPRAESAAPQPPGAPPAPARDMSCAYHPESNSRGAAGAARVPRAAPSAALGRRRPAPPRQTAPHTHAASRRRAAVALRLCARERG